MAHGAFTDRTSRPSEEDVETALGRAVTLWAELIAYLEKTFKVRSDWKFYGVNYGWALAFRKSGRAFVSLYPGASGLTLQVILKDDRIALVPGEMMIPELRTASESAPPYAEGRWIFFAVSSRPKLEVAKTLISLRAGA